MDRNTELLDVVHSFIQTRLYLQRLFKSTTWPTHRRSRHSTDTVPEFHAEAPQATVSEGLAQGSYVAARAGVEPMTLRTKDIDSNNAPHAPHGLNSEHDLPCHKETSINFAIIFHWLQVMNSHPSTVVSFVKTTLFWRSRWILIMVFCQFCWKNMSSAVANTNKFVSGRIDLKRTRYYCLISHGNLQRISKSSLML